MIRLDTVNRSLTLFLGGAQVSAPLQIVVSYSDQTAATYLGASQLSNSNGVTAVTICSAPAASTIRDIDMVTVLNTDTGSQVVTIQLLDTATTYKIISTTLLVGEKLTYTHGSAWQVLDNTGNLKTVVLSTSGVNSFSAGSTGLTPSTATTGAVTLGGTLAVANGGTGTSSPSLVAGTNVSITGTWPNQTVNATASGSVTSVTATSPVASSGGATPDISLSASYGDTQNPYASKTANYVLAAPDGAAGVPTFRALVTADIPSLSYVGSVGATAPITSTGGLTPTIGVTSAALTKTDDTNVTVTLGGAPTTALLAATSLTLGWNGQLAVARGGTGASTAATARSNLSAAQSGANTDITSVALTTGTITTAPSSSDDIVNKSYADSIATGINFHAACNYATAAALSTSYTYNNGASGVGATITAVAVGTLTIDGYTFTSGDVGKRILIKNETGAYVSNSIPSAAFNGVYTLTTAGTAGVAYVLTRATDYDTSGTGINEIDAGDLLLVLSGTTNANTSWVQQTLLPITVGTTSITFIQFAAIQTYTAGTGLSLITNQFSITNTGTAGTYGSASQVPVIVTNAQGQVTGVTNTAIAISGSAVSGNISGNAANVTGIVAVANGGTGAATTTANFIFSGPSSGSPAAPTFRALTTADIPALAYGSVSSVGLALPSIMTVSGSPVTSSGTLTGTLTTQAVNAIFAGPSSGAAAAPTFRSLTTADIPALSYVTSVAATVPSFLSIAGSPITSSGTLAISYSGTALPIANGGTGQTTASAAFNALSPITTTGDLIIGNGTNSATRLAIGANTYVLTSNGTTATWAASTGGGGSAYSRTTFTATAGQTAFTVTYAVGYLQIYVNGVLLTGSDYTASSGTGFTLNVACAAGDIVEALVITTSVTGVTTGKAIAMSMIFGY